MLIEIKSWRDGKIIQSIEADDLKTAIIKLVSSGADLSGADLSGANLSGVNLSGANLSRANLSRANLSGANLSGANLSRANLSGANLCRADLCRADLYRADLHGEKINKTPIQILGLDWWICITESHIQIGCEVHKAAEWKKFTDKEISEMHSDALAWWKQHKKIIMALHAFHVKGTK